jgi:hypothetical protein
MGMTINISKRFIFLQDIIEDRALASETLVELIPWDETLFIHVSDEHAI